MTFPSFTGRPPLFVDDCSDVSGVVVDGSEVSSDGDVTAVDTVGVAN